MDNNEGNLLQALEEGSRKNFGSDVDFIDFGDHSSFHASRSGLGFFNCNYAPPTRDPPITKKLIDSLYKKIFQLELIHEERGDDVYEGLQHTPSVMLGILSTALARLPKPEAKRREQSCNSSPPSSRPNHTRRISAPSTPPTPSHSRSLSVRSVHFSISRQPRAISAEVVQAFVSAKSKQPITTLNMQERNSYYMHTQKALYQSRVLPEKIMDVVLSYTNFNMHCLRCGILYNASLLPNNSNMCPIKPHPEYDRDKGRGLRATVSHLPPFQEEKVCSSAQGPTLFIRLLLSFVLPVSFVRYFSFLFFPLLCVLRMCVFVSRCLCRVSSTCRTLQIDTQEYLFIDLRIG